MKNPNYEQFTPRSPQLQEAINSVENLSEEDKKRFQVWKDEMDGLSKFYAKKEMMLDMLEDIKEVVKDEIHTEEDVEEMLYKIGTVHLKCDPEKKQMFPHPELRQAGAVEVEYDSARSARYEKKYGEIFQTMRQHLRFRGETMTAPATRNRIVGRGLREKGLRREA